MTNKCVKKLVGIINVFQVYPRMFRQMVTSGVAICRGHSTTTGHTGRIVIRIAHNTDTTWVAYKEPTTPKDDNHLPKHFGVNLEYINKSN
jgi:hypothetical protein